MTLSELVETLERIRFEEGEDIETDIDGIHYNGATLLIRREGEDW